VVTRRVKTGGAYVGAGGLGAPSPPQWQNTYEDQEFTGAYVVDPGGGPDQWQYSGSGIAYTPVTFDGYSDWLNRGGNLTGVVDSGYFTIAAKLNLNSTAAQTILACAPGTSGTTPVVSLTKNVSGGITLAFRDSTNAAAVGVLTLSDGSDLITDLNTDYTIHVAASKDGGGVARCWINGVETALSQGGVPWSLAGDVDLTHAGITNWRIGVNAAEIANYLNSDVSFVWFHAGATSAAYITDPTKFYTVDGANLGANGSTPLGGTQPLIYMTGTAGEWNQGRNLGSGGNFTRAVPQRQIGFMAGAPATTSIPILLASNSAANDIVAQVYSNENQTTLVTTITATAAELAASKYCDDRGTADTGGATWVFYYKHKSVTGLTANTRYWVKLTQGSVIEGAYSNNSRYRYQDSVSMWTAPAPGTDFRLWTTGCDRHDTNLVAGAESGDFAVLPLKQPHPNHYYYMRKYQKDNPTKPQYLCFIDDLGYADGANVQDTNKQATGEPPLIAYGDGVTPGAGAQYNYGLFYACLLGMGADLAETSESVLWGRQKERNWMVRNCNWMVQWGDHELSNDFGFTRFVGAADMPTLYNSAAAAWDALFGPLRPSPDLRVIDTTARHWVATLGDLKLATFDRITNMTAEFVDINSAFTTWYGNGQIDDVLTAFDDATPFKVIGRATGDKYFATTAATPWAQNHPMKTHALTEWQRLYTRTGAAVQSIMDNPNTNGTSGVFVGFQGDTHRMQYMHHAAAAYTGNAAEGWDHWVQGCAAHGAKRINNTEANQYMVNGGSWDGTSVHYVSDSGLTSVVTPIISALSFDVNGSLATKQMAVSLWDYLGAAVATATYEVGSNEPI
jgi:hypothetical protein